MGSAVEYQKVMTELVFINLPGPPEPNPGMSGGELLHGFLAELYHSRDASVKTWLDSLCGKWSVHYRSNGK